MRKQWVLKILLILLLAGIIIPGYSYGEIIFEDSFDNHPDFFPKTSSESCSMTSCKDTVPGDWDFYTNRELWHPSVMPDSQPVIQISGLIYSGSSGKSLVRYLEANDGGSGDGWGANGCLAKDLGKDYKEIYVQYKIKFQPGFKWKTVRDPQMWPALKISGFYHWDRTGNTGTFFSTGNSAPIYVFDVGNSPVYGFIHLHAFRCDPQETCYYCPGRDYNDGVKKSFNFIGKPAFEDSLGDGNWHILEVHAKMNSSAGVADGVLEFWADGVLEFSRSDISWMEPGSPGDLGWNVVFLGYNAYNNFLDTWDFTKTYSIDETVVYSAKTWKAIQAGTSKPPMANPAYWTKIADYSGGGEEYIAYDDVVVSTSYIGPDYVIGGCDINGDGAVNVLDVQLCVNVVLGIEAREEIVNKAKQAAEPLDVCDVLDVQTIVNIILTE